MADSKRRTGKNNLKTPPPSSSRDVDQDEEHALQSRFQYALVIRDQPAYVFPGESFEVEFALTGTNRSVDSPPSNLEVRASLSQPADDASFSERYALEILREPRLSPSRQTGKLVAKINESSLASSKQVNNTFSIRFEIKGDGINGVTTSLIAVVQAKLTVSTSSDWSGVWYKDEGRRDKCLEVIVTARDAHSKVFNVSGRLQVELCYDVKSASSGSPLISSRKTTASQGIVPVMNQDLLRIMEDERSLELDQEGKARVRYRIEDVSKNHQGQSFVVRISHSRTDVAPCCTPPVSVRSKRNKRHRANSSQFSTDPPAMSVSQTIHPPPPPPVRLDDIRVREAVLGILRWSDEVVNGIYPLQWQVVGYAHNPDGTLDYSRPYHNMQNPNGFIARILGIYNETTREQLHFLRNTFEPRQTPVGYGEAYPTYPGMPPQPFYEAMPHFPREAGYIREGVTVSTTTPPRFARDSPTNLPPRYPAPIRETSPGYLGRDSLVPPQQRDYLAKLSSVGSPPDDDSSDDESKVEYVLAKQYKSSQTGEPLGFPAYSAQKEIIGFFRESGVGVRNFCPIRRFSFGPKERRQATEILQEAMVKNSMAVHSLKNWGSLASLLDHALVYDWSKDIQK